MTILDVFSPVGRRYTPPARPAARRLSTLDGARVALYWNQKSGGDRLLARIAERLAAAAPRATFVPATGSIGSGRVSASPADLDHIAREFDAVVAATAD